MNVHGDSTTVVLMPFVPIRLPHTDAPAKPDTQGLDIFAVELVTYMLLRIHCLLLTLR